MRIWIRLLFEISEIDGEQTKQLQNRIYNTEKTVIRTDERKTKLDELKNELQNYHRKYPFIDWEEINNSDFAHKWQRELTTELTKYHETEFISADELCQLLSLVQRVYDQGGFHLALTKELQTRINTIRDVVRGANQLQQQGNINDPEWDA